jgi:hypothetical protein
MRVMLAIPLLAFALLALVPASAARALSASASGIYIAMDEGGQPTEKVLRVSRAGDAWQFEDRQPDGSWLDVSCHGGCEHRESRPEDLIAFFGSAPPPDIRPECVQNAQYAFCQLVKPSEQREGYVLVVRVGEQWLPVSLVRLPEPPDGEGERPAPRFEAARAPGI